MQHDFVQISPPESIPLFHVILSFSQFSQKRHLRFLKNLSLKNKGRNVT